MTKALLSYACTPDRVGLGQPGSQDRVAMTILVANRTTKPVPVEQITLTLPQGPAATDLLAPGTRFTAGSVRSTQPTAWTTSVAANQVVLIPVTSDFCVLAHGDTLQFTLSGLRINAAGAGATALVAVAENLHDDGPRTGVIPVHKVQPDFRIEAFFADQTNVAPGSPVTLTWNVVGALSCSLTASVLDVVRPLADGANVCSGTLAEGTALAGSRTCTLQGPTVFTLTAQGKGSGGDVALVSQLLATVNEPAAKLTAYPPVISKGASATLRWVAADASKLLLYTKPAHGEHTTTDLTNSPVGTARSQLLVSTKYSLCAFTNANDEYPAQQTDLEVSVEPAQWQSPPTASGATTPAYPGDPVTLAWTVLNVDHCRITCDVPGFPTIDGLPAAGAKTVTLPDPGVPDAVATFTVTPVMPADLGDFTSMPVAVPVTNVPGFVQPLAGPGADVPPDGYVDLTWEATHADAARIVSNLPGAIPQTVDPKAGKASVLMPALVIPTPVDFTLTLVAQAGKYVNASSTTVGCVGQAITQWCKASTAGDQVYDYVLSLNSDCPNQRIAVVGLEFVATLGVTGIDVTYGQNTVTTYFLPEYMPAPPTAQNSLVLASGDYLVAIDTVFATDASGNPSLWYLKLSTAQGHSVEIGTQSPPGTADPPCHAAVPAGQQIVAISCIFNNAGSGGPFAGVGIVPMASGYGS